MKSIQILGISCRFCQLMLQFLGFFQSEVNPNFGDQLSILSVVAPFFWILYLEECCSFSNSVHLLMESTFRKLKVVVIVSREGSQISSTFVRRRLIVVYFVMAQGRSICSSVLLLLFGKFFPPSKIRSRAFLPVSLRFLLGGCFDVMHYGAGQMTMKLPRCTSTPKVKGFTLQEKQEILRFHNTKRQQILQGAFSTLPKARQMNMLQWDEALEREAER